MALREGRIKYHCCVRISWLGCRTGGKPDVLAATQRHFVSEMKLKAIFFAVVGIFFSTAIKAESYFELDYVQSSLPRTCYAWSRGQAIVSDCSLEEQGRRMAVGTMLKEVYHFEIGYYDSGKSLSVFDLILGARLFRVGSAYITTHVGYSAWSSDVPDESCFGSCGSYKETGGSRLYGLGIEYYWVTLEYDVISGVKYLSDSRGHSRSEDVERLSLGVKVKF